MLNYFKDIQKKYISIVLLSLGMLLIGSLMTIIIYKLTDISVVKKIKAHKKIKAQNNLFIQGQLIEIPEIIRDNIYFNDLVELTDNFNSALQNKSFNLLEIQYAKAIICAIQPDIVIKKSEKIFSNYLNGQNTENDNYTELSSEMPFYEDRILLDRDPEYMKFTQAILNKKLIELQSKNINELNCVIRSNNHYTSCNITYDESKQKWIIVNNDSAGNNKQILSFIDKNINSFEISDNKDIAKQKGGFECGYFAIYNINQKFYNNLNISHPKDNNKTNNDLFKQQIMLANYVLINQFAIQSHYNNLNIFGDQAGYTLSQDCFDLNVKGSLLSQIELLLNRNSPTLQKLSGKNNELVCLIIRGLRSGQFNKSDKKEAFKKFYSLECTLKKSDKEIIRKILNATNINTPEINSLKLSNENIIGKAINELNVVYLNNEKKLILNNNIDIDIELYKKESLEISKISNELIKTHATKISMGQFNAAEFCNDFKVCNEKVMKKYQDLTLIFCNQLKDCIDKQEDSPINNTLIALIIDVRERIKSNFNTSSLSIENVSPLLSIENPNK